MPRKTKREWRKEGNDHVLMASGVFMARVERVPESGWITMSLNPFHDPRTGKLWRSKKQVREFLDSLGGG
jgi:hypothetical protein